MYNHQISYQVSYSLNNNINLVRATKARPLYLKRSAAFFIIKKPPRKYGAALIIFFRYSYLVLSYGITEISCDA